MRERKYSIHFSEPLCCAAPTEDLGKSIAEVLRHHKITQGEQQTQEQVTALLDGWDFPLHLYQDTRMNFLGPKGC